MNKNSSRFLLFILMGFVSPVFSAFAQDGSVKIPDAALPQTPSAAEALSRELVAPSPRAIESVATPPTEPSPRATESEVLMPAPQTPPVETSSLPAESNNSVGSADTRSMIPFVLVGVTLLSFGYFVAQSRKSKSKKENKKEKSRCFDLKNMVDKKLKELTDLEGILESKAKDAAREEIEDAIEGTSAREMLALIKKAEKEYGRLKKLYEECMLEFDERLFKGVIVENSLSDKSILKKVKVEKTYESNGWTLHDVLVTEDQITEIPKHMAVDPWYAHFWESGKDEVRVIFKDRVFTIIFSDKSTWAEAVAYGKSIGIKEEQLDFPID